MCKHARYGRHKRRRQRDLLDLLPSVVLIALFMAFPVHFFPQTENVFDHASAWNQPPPTNTRTLQRGDENMDGNRADAD